MKIYEVLSALENMQYSAERGDMQTGIAYIEETGNLITQYGEKCANLSRVNKQLNDNREAYHICKAKYFSLLGEIESLRAQIDRLQHIDTEKGDTVLTLDHMKNVIKELAENTRCTCTNQEDFDQQIKIALGTLEQFVSILEVKLKNTRAFYRRNFWKRSGIFCKSIRKGSRS